MADITKQDVKSRIFGLVSDNVKEVASYEAIQKIKKIPEIERIRIIENTNYSMSSINSDSYFFRDSSSNFIWGISTWGVDSIDTSISVVSGEYNQSTRSGVAKRDEFRT